MKRLDRSSARGNSAPLGIEFELRRVAQAKSRAQGSAKPIEDRRLQHPVPGLQGLDGEHFSQQVFTNVSELSAHARQQGIRVVGMTQGQGHQAETRDPPFHLALHLSQGLPADPQPGEVLQQDGRLGIGELEFTGSHLEHPGRRPVVSPWAATDRDE